MATAVGRATAAERLLAFALATVAASSIGLAFFLPPDPRGHGTHEALGLPPCGFIERFGVPCPSCGMTTCFALAAKGRFFDAFLVQPAGLYVFLIAAATAASVVPVTLLGISVSDRATVPRLRALSISLIAAILLGWAYKLYVVLG